MLGLMWSSSGTDPADPIGRQSGEVGHSDGHNDGIDLPLVDTEAMRTVFLTIT